MIFLRLLGPDVVAERDAEFLLALRKRLFICQRPRPELSVRPASSGSASGSAPARPAFERAFGPRPQHAVHPLQHMRRTASDQGARRSDRSTSHRTGPKARNRRRPAGRRTDRAVSRGGSRASQACPESLPRSAARSPRLEPTNQTRSTMRARTCAAKAACSFRSPSVARIRAMRPAELIWSTSRAQR